MGIIYHSFDNPYPNLKIKCKRSGGSKQNADFTDQTEFHGF